MRRFPEPEFPAIWHCFQGFSALMPTALFHFLASTSPTVPTYGSTPPGFSMDWRLDTEYTLACSQAGYSLSKKLEKISGEDFHEHERYPIRSRQVPCLAPGQTARRRPLCGFSFHPLRSRQWHPRQGAAFHRTFRQRCGCRTLRYRTRTGLDSRTLITCLRMKQTLSARVG